MVLQSSLENGCWAGHVVDNDRVLGSTREPHGFLVMRHCEPMHASSMSARAGYTRDGAVVNAIKNFPSCNVGGRKAEEAIVVGVNPRPRSIYNKRPIPVKERTDLADLFVRSRVVQI